MTEPWFHIDTIPDPGEPLELEGDEARHAGQSRRRAVGQRIVLFDGCGVTASAEIVELSRRRLCAVVRERREHAPPVPRIHLASALPKGDRQSTLLSMATQLGMASFTPLDCHRSIARPGASAADRWNRICREACKQSQRPHLPELRSATTPEALVSDTRDSRDTNTPESIVRHFVFHPSGAPVKSIALSNVLQDVSDVHLLIGPEGGFDDEEVRTLVSLGAEPTALGDAILRTETAAAAALTLFSVLSRC